MWKDEFSFQPCRQCLPVIKNKATLHVTLTEHAVQPCDLSPLVFSTIPASNRVNGTGNLNFFRSIFLFSSCSARDWDGKDYLRIIPRVVW